MRGSHQTVKEKEPLLTDGKKEIVSSKKDVLVAETVKNQKAVPVKPTQAVSETVKPVPIQSSTMRNKVQLDNTTTRKVYQGAKRTNPSIPQRNNRYVFQGHCYYCVVWGHMQRDCWWKYPSLFRSSRRSQNVNRGIPARAVKFCEFCRREGHVVETCRWKPRTIQSWNRFSVLEDLEECTRCGLEGHEGHEASDFLTLLPEQEKQLTSVKLVPRAVQLQSETSNQRVQEKAPKKFIYRAKNKEQEAHIVEVALKA